MTNDQAEKMRHALEAIAACGALNDDHLPEQRLMLEALRPFEGRWTVMMRAEEAEKSAAKMRTMLERILDLGLLVDPGEIRMLRRWLEAESR